MRSIQSKMVYLVDIDVVAPGAPMKRRREPIQYDGAARRCLMDAFEAVSDPVAPRTPKRIRA